jgi:hypothetical protein
MDNGKLLAETGIASISPEPLDELPAGTGRLGYDQTNPIPGNAYHYIPRLRCPQGHPIKGERDGNLGEGVDGHIVDRWTIRCLEGEYEAVIHCDMYHQGTSGKAPEGLRLLAPEDPAED